MEELMLSLPPYLDFGEERAWLTVTSTNHDDCWTAFYMCQHGNGMGNFVAEGTSPYEALTNLKGTLDLGQLWDAPTVPEEGVDGLP